MAQVVHRTLESRQCVSSVYVCICVLSCTCELTYIECSHQVLGVEDHNRKATLEDD